MEQNKKEKKRKEKHLRKHICVCKHTTCLKEMVQVEICSFN